MTFYTVYKITNKINNKTYIGKHQTNNLDDGYMGSGRLITRAIRKYGIDNFTKEILYIFDNQADMNNKEKDLVLVSEGTYNLCPGGQGGFGYIRSHPNYEDWQLLGAKKGQAALIEKYGSNKTFLGKKHSIETKDKISKSLKGKVGYWKNKTIPENTKKKMSDAKKGICGGNHPQFGTCWITNGITNKKIKKVELDNWTMLGYYLGRIIHVNRK